MAKGVYKRKSKVTKRKNVLKTGTIRTGKSSETLDKALTDNEVAQQEVKEEVMRASERSSIFLDDCRVPVRNLTDVKLLNERGRLSTKIYELRRTLEYLENLSFQMYREAEYRKL